MLVVVGTVETISGDRSKNTSNNHYGNQDREGYIKYYNENEADIAHLLCCGNLSSFSFAHGL